MGLGPLVRVVLLVFGPLLEWAARHPLRTSGGLGAAAAGAVVLASLGTFDAATMTLSGVTLARLLRFSVAHPAYPLAVVVGLGTFLLWR